MLATRKENDEVEWRMIICGRWKRRWSRRMLSKMRMMLLLMTMMTMMMMTTMIMMMLMLMMWRRRTDSKIYRATVCASRGTARFHKSNLRL